MLRRHDSTPANGTSIISNSAGFAWPSGSSVLGGAASVVSNTAIPTYLHDTNGNYPPSATLLGSSSKIAIPTYLHDTKGNYLASATLVASSSSASPRNENEEEHGPHESVALAASWTISLSNPESPSVVVASNIASPSAAFDDGSWSPTKCDQNNAPIATSMLQYGNDFPSPAFSADNALTSMCNNSPIHGPAPRLSRSASPQDGETSNAPEPTLSSSTIPSIPSNTPAPSLTTTSSALPSPAASTLVLPTFVYSSIGPALGEPTPTPTPTSASSTSSYHLVIIVIDLSSTKTTSPNVKINTCILTGKQKRGMPTPPCRELDRRGASTLTLETTVVTGTLPRASGVVVSRTSAVAKSTADGAKASSSKKVEATSKPTTTTTSHSSAPTRIPDPRCPYPYPDINCDGDTTLVTKTKKEEASKTKEGVTTTAKPSSSHISWCPYPGQDC
ncbi:hypothetical protein CC86DRAFT_377441 [Ophiobolus disseminans]|uniref:Uncharacterized protein n=1 Tax=Ophiobolus disseminans TaxID=1469910 RepID=A0A6A7AG39_9PLEO|nr:hypothetical protein CC86DRAFT_377441 [Ophiobolus disseminans]